MREIKQERERDREKREKWEGGRADKNGNNVSGCLLSQTSYPDE